jgi:hypothetical protein
MEHQQSFPTGAHRPGGSLGWIRLSRPRRQHDPGRP